MPFLVHYCTHHKEKYMYEDQNQLPCLPSVSLESILDNLSRDQLHAVEMYLKTRRLYLEEQEKRHKENMRQIFLDNKDMFDPNKRVRNTKLMRYLHKNIHHIVPKLKTVYDFCRYEMYSFDNEEHNDIPF